MEEFPMVTYCTKQNKKIISLILSLIFVFQLSFVTQAETVDYSIDYDQIISALQANQ